MPVAEELDAVIQQEQLLIPEDESSSPKLSIAELVKMWLRTALVTALLFFFLVAFVIQGFRVYGSCMEPNLHTGERVLGNKLIYRFKSPARGDVVVFKYPKDPSKIYIKRVIGLPGEVIEIKQGRVFINDAQIHEPYLLYLTHDSYGPERIKPNSLFVMGDHRDQSNDSRFWGELPIRNIEAKAWVKYWPVKKATLLH
jgi:signal peptidase I